MSDETYQVDRRGAKEHATRRSGRAVDFSQPPSPLSARSPVMKTRSGTKPWDTWPFTCSTILSRAIPAQGLQAVGRGDAQVVQGTGVVQHAELAPGDLLDLWREPVVALAEPDSLGRPVTQALDHGADYSARGYGSQPAGRSVEGALPLATTAKVRRQTGFFDNPSRHDQGRHQDDAERRAQGWRRGPSQQRGGKYRSQVGEGPVVGQRDNEGDGDATAQRQRASRVGALNSRARRPGAQSA